MKKQYGAKIIFPPREIANYGDDLRENINRRKSRALYNLLHETTMSCNIKLQFNEFESPDGNREYHTSEPRKKWKTYIVIIIAVEITTE